MECPSGLVNQLDISAGLCSCFAVFSHLEQSPLQKGRHGQRLRQGGLFKHFTFFSLWSFSLIEWFDPCASCVSVVPFPFRKHLLSFLPLLALLFLPLGSFPGGEAPARHCCTGTCSRRVWKLSRIQMEAAKSAVETWHRFYRWTTSSRPSTTQYSQQWNTALVSQALCVGVCDLLLRVQLSCHKSCQHALAVSRRLQMFFCFEW